MPIPVGGGGGITSGSDLGILRNQVRLQADVDAADVTDAEINNAINFAYEQALGDEPWPFLITSANFDTVANQPEYTLVALGGTSDPDIEGHRVLHVMQNGVKLEYFHPTRYYTNQPYGAPSPSVATYASHWTVLGGTRLALYPRPSGIVSTQVVFVAVPAPLAEDAAIPVFPRRYHQILKLGALAKVYQKISDFESAAAVQVEFEQRLEEMRKELLQGQPQSLFAWGEGDNFQDPFFGRLRYPFE